MNLTAQKSRYPRSYRDLQRANSSKKAEQFSSLKRKPSSSSSYAKSEMPFSLKCLSTMCRAWVEGAIFVLEERLVGLFLRDCVSITEIVAWWQLASHLPGGHFLPGSRFGAGGRSPIHAV